MIDYDSFSHCHLMDIFFAIHAGAKELNTAWIINCSKIFTPEKINFDRNWQSYSIAK